MNKASPNNEGEPGIVKNDNNVVTLTETLNPDQILQEIDSQIVDIEQAGDQLKPFIPKLQKTRSEIAKILINSPKNSEVEVQRLWTEFWDTVDALPELGENKNQATIQSTMTENQPKKPEKDEIDTKLDNALKDWRNSIRSKGEDSPEAKAAEKIFKDLKDIKMGIIPKKPETKKEAKKGPKKVDTGQTKIPAPPSTPEKENEQPNVYAEEILADLDRKKDEEEEKERYEKARKAAIAYISGKEEEEEDLTPLPPPVIDYEGIDSALGLSNKPPKEEPVPIANKQIENIDVQSDDSSDGLSEIERIFKSKVYKSPLERSFDRAMSASSNLQEVVGIVTQFAEATKDPEIIAGITTSIGKILNMPTKEDEGDGEKIESLLEILSEIAPIAYEKERNSSSDKVGRIVHENGNGLPDIEETLPPIDPVIKKRAKKSIVVPEVVEKMGDAAKLAFVETRIKSGDIPTPEQEIEIERIKKAQKTIEKIRDSRLERVAKLGIQGFDAVGKNYNKLPTKYKVAISISLLAATVGFGGAAITAASTGWRVVSTAGLYVTIERALAASYSRSTDGKERSRKRKIIHGLEAVAFATLVSFYGGEAIKNLGGEAIIEKIRSIYSSLGITTDAPKVSGLRLNQEDTVLNKTADAINTEINPDAVSIPTEVTELTEAESLANLEHMRAIDAAKESATSVSFAHEVSSGDNMYKVLKEYFPEVSNLEGPQQTNLIENILAEIKKNPADYGITSNDVNQLKIGDTIDLEKIQEIIENKQINGKGLVEVAENLSEEAKNRIANYSPSKTIQAPEIPTSKVEAISGTEIADQKISDTEVEVADNSNSILRTSDNTQSANATIDTPSRAPINETLEQIQFKTDLGVKETVEATYGSKGIFGIGKNDGMNIWNNIKGESVDSLPKFKHDSIIPNPEQAVPNTYLQQNYIRQKTEKLIGDLIEGVGIQPKEKESIGDFVKRALGKAVSDRINSPKIISTDTLTT